MRSLARHAIRTLAFLAAAACAAGQTGREVAREAETVAPGVRLIFLEYDRQEYRQKVVVLEIERETPGCEFGARLGGDLWAGRDLRAMGEDERVRALFQVAAQPRQGGAAREWPGLTVVAGRLVAAPGGGPVLCVGRDGYRELRDSAGTAFGPVATFGGGAAGAGVSVAWINRSPALGTVGLVCDPGLVRESLLGESRSLAAAEVTFGANASLVGGSSGPAGAPKREFSPWKATPDGSFQWEAEPVFEADRAYSFAAQWTGLAAVGAEEAARLRDAMAAARSGSLVLRTDPPWQDFRDVVPLGDWLVRDGEVVVPNEGATLGAAECRSAIGLHRERQTLWLAYVKAGERDARGMNRRELADLMAALGATDAAEGPSGERAAIEVAGKQIEPASRVPDRCRLALVVRLAGGAGVDPVEGVDGQDARGGVGAGAWRNLCRGRAGVAITATSQLDPATGPEKAIDGRRGAIRALDHFWASAPGDENPALTLDFVEERTLRQIDFAFAEESGFSSAFNARLVRFVARRGGEERWMPAGELRNDALRARRSFVFDPPLRARALRCEFAEPNALSPDNHTARVVEIAVWGRE